MQSTLQPCGSLQTVNDCLPGSSSTLELSTSAAAISALLAKGCAFFDKASTSAQALVRVAVRALLHNLQQLGPLVLPVRERWRYAMSWLARTLIDGDMELYKPSFDRAFDHFCIHTGGRGILDSLEKQLSLSPAHLVPSRETLKRYGNTSSSSIWCVAFLGLPLMAAYSDCAHTGSTVKCKGKASATAGVYANAFGIRPDAEDPLACGVTLNSDCASSTDEA